MAILAKKGEKPSMTQAAIVGSVSVFLKTHETSFKLHKKQVSA